MAIKILFALSIILTLSFMNEFKNTRSDGIDNEKLIQKEIEDKIFSKQIEPKTAMVEFLFSNSQTWTINWNAFNIPASYQYAKFNLVLASAEFATFATQVQGRPCKQIDISINLANTAGEPTEAVVSDITLRSASTGLGMIPLGVDLNNLVVFRPIGGFTVSGLATLDRFFANTAAASSTFTVNITIKVQYY